MAEDSRVNVTSMFNEVDTILSGDGVPPGEANGGTMLTSALRGPSSMPMTVELSPPEDMSSLFSTYMVSPAYYADTDELLLVKLVTAKGEPFYLLDIKKSTKPLVCGLTEVFLSPYDADTACVDECEGLPALHLVPECIVNQVFSKSLKDICTAKWFAGLVFVSNVGMQFHYCNSNSVYRVATDREGHIEAREVRGSVTCDYPVPYFLVDETVFEEGTHNLEIIESLTQANTALIEALCRVEYVSLHAARTFPDDIESTLNYFMGNHSHLTQRLLEEQNRGSGKMSGLTPCDDAFVRRQRKGEIDTLVRLMMREVELIGNLKETLEELQYIQKAVRKCPASGAKDIHDEEDDDCIDPLLRPLIKMSKEEGRSQAVLGDLDETEDMLSVPLSDRSEHGIADSDLIKSPSSGSECSR